jgi:hypothetical protein
MSVQTDGKKPNLTRFSKIQASDKIPRPIYVVCGEQYIDTNPPG